MTAAKLSALLTLAEKATPGPWRCVLGSGHNVMTAIASDAGVIADCLPTWVLIDNCAVTDHRPNMRYIAACSPEVIAALVRVTLAAQQVLEGDGYLPILDDELYALSAALKGHE